MSTTQALTLAQPQYEDEQLLATIRDTVCKGATPAQFRMFIEVCKSTGLNPFLKEVYYVPEKGIIMAARDGYLRVANEHPQFDGMETLVERDDRNIPIKATCRVWRKDRNHPTTCEAYFSEYKKSSPVWTQYPSAMISKVAEVLALKRSFSINGTVTEEEIGSEDRGSKEAQREYLAERGLDPYVAPKHQNHQPPPTKPEVIRELSDTLDQPSAIKTIEMRSAAKVAEAEQVLKDVEKDAAKGKGRSGAHGVVPLDKLAGWQKLKDAIRGYTGNDDLYKGILRTKGGAEHSNEIQTKEQAKAAWDALNGELKRLGLEANHKKQDDVLRTEMELAKSQYGEGFATLLWEHSCNSIEDTLALSAEPLEALRKAIKALGRTA